MLKMVTEAGAKTVERLFALYEESMQDLRPNFETDEAMKTAYTEFLADFLTHEGQLVLVEEQEGAWVSGLRAIEMEKGHWFLEAVETPPACRQKGYGKILLHHTLAFLQEKGMTQVTCTIHRNNMPSIRLHTSCGFCETKEPPVNCWGEEEPSCRLYRFVPLDHQKTAAY